MKIEDIFVGFNDEPKCLFCQTRLSILSHLSNQYHLEYLCRNCGEGIILIYNNPGEISFISFAIFEKEITLHLGSEMFRVEEDQKKSRWIPYFKFDFTDKVKLNNKINIILTFS